MGSTGLQAKKRGFFQKGSSKARPPLPADPGGPLQPPLPLAWLHPTEQGWQWGRPAWVISAQTSGAGLTHLERAPPAIQDLLLRPPHNQAPNTARQLTHRPLGPGHCTAVQFSRSVVSNSLQPHGLQHARPPSPLPTPGACSDLCLSYW